MCNLASKSTYVPSKCGTWTVSLCSGSFLWTRVGLWAAETSCLANSAAWISAEVSSLGTFVLMSQWGRCSPLLVKMKVPPLVHHLVSSRTFQVEFESCGPSVLWFLLCD